MSSDSARSWPIAAGLVALIAAAAAVALLGGDGGDGGSLEDVGAPTVEGRALPTPGPDVEAALDAPVVTGEGLSGGQVRVPARDSGTIVLFLAHWCPHCQREVPVVQDWIDAGGLSEDVELVSVATAIDPSRPNYPPDAWLEREGWTPPVLVDTDSSVAQTYGLTSFPFWVFVNADGEVVSRRSGELTVGQLEAAIQEMGA